MPKSVLSNGPNDEAFVQVLFWPRLCYDKNGVGLSLTEGDANLLMVKTQI